VRGIPFHSHWSIESESITVERSRGIEEDLSAPATKGDLRDFEGRLEARFATLATKIDLEDLERRMDARLKPEWMPWNNGIQTGSSRRSWTPKPEFCKPSMDMRKVQTGASDD